MHSIIIFSNGKFFIQKRTASLCSVMENILHHGTKIVPRFTYGIIMFGNGKYLGIEPHGIIMFGNGKFSTQKRTASLCSVRKIFYTETHGIIMFGNGKYPTSWYENRTTI